MYESLYKGRREEPQPSGFYLKFAQSSWTPLFGSKGTNEPKKWSVGTVVGGEAQLYGVRFDINKSADFLQFYACGGGLTAEPVVPGCTDRTAKNFNKLANKDNKTCKYTVFGCMDTLASNFKKEADRDDGSCKFVRGCMNASATNYNAKATKNDGSCVFPVKQTPIYGCKDPLAMNYNKFATRENGSCKFKKIIPKVEKPKGCFNGPMAGKSYK